jgi:putative chitinase
MPASAKIQNLLGEMGQGNPSLKDDLSRTEQSPINIGSMFKQMMAANESVQVKTNDNVSYLAEKSNDMIRKLDSITQVVTKVKNELDRAKGYQADTPTPRESAQPKMKADRYKAANDSQTMVPAANQSKFVDPKNEFKDDLAIDPIELLRQDTNENFNKVFELLGSQQKAIEETALSTGEVNEAVNTDGGREKMGFAVKAVMASFIAGAVISGIKSMGETVAEKLVDLSDWMKEKLGYSALETDEETNDKALASLNKKIASTGYTAMGGGKYKDEGDRIIMAADLPEETKKQFTKLGVKGFEPQVKAASGADESYTPLGRLNIPDTAAPLTGLTPQTSAAGGMPAMAAPPKKIASESGKKAMITAMDKRGITDPTQRAAIMAQVAHESGGFAQLSENLNYSENRLKEVFGYYRQNPDEASIDASNPYAIASKAYGNRMGNGPPPTGEGFEYRGRGFIQLTGKANYQRFGVSNPDSLLSPEKAADNALDYLLGYRGDWADTTSLTQYVNGGTNGLSERMGYFNQFVSDPSIVGEGAAASGGSNMAASSGGSTSPPQQYPPIQPQMASSAPMESSGGGGGAAVASENALIESGVVEPSSGGGEIPTAVEGDQSITKDQTNALLDIAAKNRAAKQGISLEQAKADLALPKEEPASIFSGKQYANRRMDQITKDTGMIQSLASKMGIAPNADGGFDAEMSGNFPNMINGAQVPRALIDKISSSLPIPLRMGESREMPFDNFLAPRKMMPTQAVDGSGMTNGSRNMEADKAAIPPPVIINNQQQAQPQVMAMPESKSPPPTAPSTTPMDSAFLRAMSRDFAHPTQFSSSVIV